MSSGSPLPEDMPDFVRDSYAQALDSNSPHLSLYDAVRNVARNQILRSMREQGIRLWSMYPDGVPQYVSDIISRPYKVGRKDFGRFAREVGADISECLKLF